MRDGGGKQKGSQFEREICRELSLWVSDDTHEDVFWRSAMSGGRSTVAAAKGKRLAAQAGDLSCIHPVGQNFASTFHVECKSYKDLNLLGLLSGRGHLVEFWDETCQQASVYNKSPLLIAKQNRFPAMACLDDRGARILGVIKRALLIAPDRNLRIMPLFEFLKYAVSP
jgi:hypothetical protein